MRHAPSAIADQPGAVAASFSNRGDSDILCKIDGILPRRASWSDDLILWGEEDGDRLHAFLEGGRIVELTARIDLRHPHASFPAQLVDLARYCGAHFSTADEQRVPADLSSLADAARRSDSFRFVTDPRRFFGELAAEPRTSAIGLPP